MRLTSPFDRKARMSDMLSKRGKALENAFFAQRDQELLDAFQIKLDAEQLSELTGITDPEVLEHLEQAGVTSQTVAALGLVPLVEVAWADGRMQEAEQEAILEAALKSGIAEGSPSRRLLQTWLVSPPPADLREGWKAYVASLKETMSDAALRSVKAGVMGRATDVAKAAGGLLGIGAIGPLEKKTLADLEAAFE